MKKAKTTGKPAAQRRTAAAIGAKAKVRGGKVARRTPAATQPSGELLDGAVADLVAITEELRELVVELRALIRREEQEEEGEGEVTMVITEGEGPEDLE
ncbi:MAG TPA: hypothetical protein VEF07_08840 [Candidatus Binataceae bacterium]|nr:hypothetical protein [Candidatus Binataceae bacterium]